MDDNIKRSDAQGRHAIAVVNIDGSAIGTGSSSGSTIDSEVPTGDIDGLNTDYATFYPYKPASPKIFLNGLRQREGFTFDYIEAGGSAIQFFNAPLLGDTLTIDYVMA